VVNPRTARSLSSFLATTTTSQESTTAQSGHLSRLQSELSLVARAVGDDDMDLHGEISFAPDFSEVLRPTHRRGMSCNRHHPQCPHLHCRNLERYHPSCCGLQHLFIRAIAPNRRLRPTITAASDQMCGVGHLPTTTHVQSWQPLHPLLS